MSWPTSRFLGLASGCCIRGTPPKTTSGSFVFGWDGARRQADMVSQRLGVPASSSSFAFVDALRALGTRRIAVAATYPDAVARAFVSFLADAEIEVVSVGAENIVTAAEVATLGRDRVRRFVAAADHRDAESVLVPDTALHTVDVPWAEHDPPVLRSVAPTRSRIWPVTVRLAETGAPPRDVEPAGGRPGQ